MTTTIGILVFVFMCLVVAVSLSITHIQVKKVYKAEQVISQLVTRLQEISDYIFEASATLDGNPQLKRAFEEDDEVGSFFKQLESIKEVLQSMSINEQDQEG